MGDMADDFREHQIPQEVEALRGEARRGIRYPEREVVLTVDMMRALPEHLKAEGDTIASTLILTQQKGSVYVQVADSKGDPEPGTGLFLWRDGTWATTPEREERARGWEGIGWGGKR